MQFSPIPLIRPHVPTILSAALAVSRAAPAIRRPAVGAESEPRPVAPSAVPSTPHNGHKPRSGDNNGRIWIANRAPLNEVLLGRLDLSNPHAPALLVQLPAQHAPVRVPVSVATASQWTGPNAGPQATVALRPDGCSSTQRTWYFRAQTADPGAWPAVPQPQASAEPSASVIALRANTPEMAMPFVVIHAGQGGREALYLARRFDAKLQEAGFCIHLADLPPHAQLAGPTRVHLTTAHLDSKLGVVDVEQGDTTILCQGAVTHADLKAFYDSDMEGPLIAEPYAASMALVRRLGLQLSRSKQVAQWQTTLTRLVRQAAQQREVACA